MYTPVDPVGQQYQASLDMNEKKVAEDEGEQDKFPVQIDMGSPFFFVPSGSRAASGSFFSSLDNPPGHREGKKGIGLRDK